MAESPEIVQAVKVDTDPSLYIPPPSTAESPVRVQLVICGIRIIIIDKRPPESAVLFVNVQLVNEVAAPHRYCLSPRRSHRTLNFTLNTQLINVLAPRFSATHRTPVMNWMYKVHPDNNVADSPM